jgi:hypothetical protein
MKILGQKQEFSNLLLSPDFSVNPIDDNIYVGAIINVIQNIGKSVGNLFNISPKINISNRIKSWDLGGQIVNPSLPL